MNLQIFYEELKAALKFLDLRWGEMEKAEVTIDGDKVCVPHAGREVSFVVGAKP